MVFFDLAACELKLEVLGFHLHAGDVAINLAQPADQIIRRHLANRSSARPLRLFITVGDRSQEIRVRDPQASTEIEGIVFSQRSLTFLQPTQSLGVHAGALGQRLPGFLATKADNRLGKVGREIDLFLPLALGWHGKDRRSPLPGDQ